MSNRVTDYATMVQGKLDSLGDQTLTPGESMADFESGMSLSLGDFVGYQNAQSRAFASGRLSFDEAQSAYIALGGDSYHGDWPNETPLAMKIAITRLIGELLGVA